MTLFIVHCFGRCEVVIFFDYPGAVVVFGCPVVVQVCPGVVVVFDCVLPFRKFCGFGRWRIVCHAAMPDNDAPVPPPTAPRPPPTAAIPMAAITGGRS